MLIGNALAFKGSTVFTVSVSDPLSGVVDVMARERIGSVIVEDFAGRPVGIMTERSILETLATRPGDLFHATARSLM